MKPEKEERTRAIISRAKRKVSSSNTKKTRNSTSRTKLKVIKWSAIFKSYHLDVPPWHLSGEELGLVRQTPFGVPWRVLHLSDSQLLLQASSSVTQDTSLWRVHRILEPPPSSVPCKDSRRPRLPQRKEARGAGSSACTWLMIFYVWSTMIEC